MLVILSRYYRVKKFRTKTPLARIRIAGLSLGLNLVTNLGLFRISVI